jgi:rhodanese-related sulfurtransferase
VVAPSVDTLSADQLNELLQSDPEVFVVDVRTVSEIQNDGTIEGSVHIPIADMERRYTEIPKDKKVIVACARGGRAGRGATILQNHGYKDVFSVGLSEYKSKGYKLIYPETVQ